MKQYIALCLAAASLSCAPAHAPTPVSDAPRLAPSTPAPAASSDSGSSGVAPGATRVSVRGGVVYVQDQAVEASPSGKLRRLDGLFGLMRSSRAASSDGKYRLSISGALDAAQFKSVAQTAAYAGWPEAVLETPAGDVSLHALVPNPPGVLPRGTAFPESVLVLVVRAGEVEVWQAPTTAASAGVPAAQRLDGGRALGETLTRECETRQCNPALFMADNTAPYHAVESVLVTLARVVKSLPLEVHFRLREPGPSGTSPGTISVTSGRLPPEVIQKTVRAAYGELRECYEAGLKVDPELEGKVVVRFVIDRGGSVTKAAPTDGTTLQDEAVVECMIGVFQGVTFPRPEGGILTVVYPLVFKSK